MKKILLSVCLLLASCVQPSFAASDDAMNIATIKRACVIIGLLNNDLDLSSSAVIDAASYDKKEKLSKEERQKSGIMSLLLVTMLLDDDTPEGTARTDKLELACYKIVR